MRINIKSELKYLLVGIGAFVTEYLVFISLFYWISISLSVSNIISFLIGFVFSFIGNRQWTFGGSSDYYYKKYQQILLYGLLAVINLFLSTFLIYCITTYIKLPAYIAKIVTVLIIITWNYLIYKYYIFKKLR
jgi:putative flippase GtrA